MIMSIRLGCQPGRDLHIVCEQAGRGKESRSPSGLAAKVPPRVGQLGVARAPEAAAAPTTAAAGPLALRTTFHDNGMQIQGPGGSAAVELRVHAVGLNFRDVLNVLGEYPGEPGPPGADGAGVERTRSRRATPPVRAARTAPQFRSPPLTPPRARAQPAAAGRTSPGSARRSTRRTPRTSGSSSG